MRTPSFRAAALFGVALFTFTGCGSDDTSEPADPRAAASDVAAESPVSVVDAWSRQPVAGQSSSAVYGKIVNDGDEDITAVAARTAVSDRVELHEVLVDDDGSMTMQQRDGGFVVPAGGSLTLEPGSFHVMLMGIDPATYPDEVEIEIEFDDETTVAVVAPVRAVDESAEMDHDMDDEMDHDMDDDSHDGETPSSDE